MKNIVSTILFNVQYIDKWCLNYADRQLAGLSSEQYEYSLGGNNLSILFIMLDLRNFTITLLPLTNFSAYDYIY